MANPLFVSGATSASSTTASTTRTITISVTSGNTLLVFGSGVGVAISSVTDSASNSYSIVSPNTTNTVEGSIWGTTIGGLTTTGSITVTVHFASSTRSGAACAQYSGGSSYGNTNSATGTSTNPNVSVTTQDNNNLVVGAFSDEGTATWSSHTGDGTLRENVAGAGTTTPGASIAEGTSGTPAAVAVGATLSTSKAWIATAVELRSIAAPMLKSLTALSAAFSGLLGKKSQVPLTGKSFSFSGSVVKQAHKVLSALSSAFFAVISTSLLQFVNLTAVSAAVRGSLTKRTSAVLNALNASFNGLVIRKTLFNLAARSSAFVGTAAKKTSARFSAANAAILGAVTPAVVFLQSLTAISHAISGLVSKKINKNISAVSNSILGSLSKLTQFNLSAISHGASGSIAKLTKFRLSASSAIISASVVLSIYLTQGMNAISFAFSAVFAAIKTGGQTFFQSFSTSMSAVFGILNSIFNSGTLPPTYTRTSLSYVPMEWIKLQLVLNPDTQIFPINNYPDFPNGIPRSALVNELDNRIAERGPENLDDSEGNMGDIPYGLNTPIHTWRDIK